MRKAILIFGAPLVLIVGVILARTARYGSDSPGLTPVRLTPRDLERMHGTHERIAVRNYEEAIRMYRQLILAAAGG
jgi:acetylornithine deacetylase/succinyl-diaminopimelate desuccinylase-like protein